MCHPIGAISKGWYEDGLIATSGVTHATPASLQLILILAINTQRLQSN